MVDVDLQKSLTEVLEWLLSEGVGEINFPIYDNRKKESPAYKWQKAKFGSKLIPLWQIPEIELKTLIGIDDQKQRICENTEFFLRGFKANNALLTGARGCGKSTLIRALLNKYYKDGLRVIEVSRESITDWHRLISLLEKQKNKQQKYILFCDDLSFEKNENEYKALKSLLDGGFEVLPSNVLIYATSNRRHLIPEYFEENLTYKTENEEIHAGEVVEEKISLSDRFGLWISFYSIDQELYLQICRQWLIKYGISKPQLSDYRTPALQWALYRGGRNGRIAEQFARNYFAKKKK